jgi:hypothetical protein
MPKGETSRPYNRTEKKAVKTLSGAREGAKGKSSTNISKIMKGPRTKEALKTLSDRDMKETVRKLGKKQERDTGSSVQKAYTRDGFKKRK